MAITTVPTDQPVRTDGPSTALLTDRYELTMLQAALASGAAKREAVFEVFARKLPRGRRYGVVAGVSRIIESITRFRFDENVLAALKGVVNDETMDFLANYRFRGNIDGYREGELYFPHSPIFTVQASFADAVLIETLILSTFNYDSAVASAASRMVVAANGRPLTDMGSRRTHEQAAVAAARAAYIAGFASTSNLEAGRLYGIPTVGTSAHAFTLAHATEREAFAAQLDSLGIDTTLLVDTYDIEEGIRLGVELAQERGATGPGAVRIDSGDLAEEAHKARLLLDSLGAADTQITISSDLDEYAIADLADEPVDRYGAGTRLVCGSGAPTCGFVYKLVAIGDEDGGLLEPVAKRSRGKVSVGGRKVAYRLLDSEGYAYDEQVTVRRVRPDTTTGDAAGQRALQVPLMRDGMVVTDTTLAQARAHHRAALSELRDIHLTVAEGPAAMDGTPR